MQQCDTNEYTAACGPAAPSWPVVYMQDIEQLLSLKAAAADGSTLQSLASWESAVPPCTNSSVDGSCMMCYENVSDSECGSFKTISGTNGAFLCNWRFVQCRDRRVVKIDMSNRVSEPQGCEQFKRPVTGQHAAADVNPRYSG